MGQKGVATTKLRCNCSDRYREDSFRHNYIPFLRERLLETIKEGNFDVLIITSQFLARRSDILASNTFSFIFVDDVDSLLKNSKNVDRVLVLLGFPHEVVESALRAVKIERKDLPKGVIMLSSATARPGRRAWSIS